MFELLTTIGADIFGKKFGFRDCLKWGVALFAVALLALGVLQW